MHDADLLVQHLGERREAVRRAGRVRDDGVARLDLVLVDAVDERAVDVLLARCRDDDLLRAGGDVRAGLGLRGEEAGAFEHDVDAQILPRQLRRIALGADLDPVAVDDEVAAIDADLARKPAVCGVVLRQVRVRFRIAEIVDRDDLDLARAFGFVQRAQHVATDAAVAVDGDLHSHGQFLRDKGERGRAFYRPPNWGARAISLGPLACAGITRALRRARGRRRRRFMMRSADFTPRSVRRRPRVPETR